MLAKLGGNTSLFCGFSCVTLMETFIFLFKSIIHLAHYGTVGPVESAETSKRKSFMKVLSVDGSPDITKDIAIDVIDYNDENEIQSHSLPSTPVNSDTVISFQRKVSLPTGQGRSLRPRFTIIDTISERDESETPRGCTTPTHPRASIIGRSSMERQRRSTLRRMRTRDRFIGSIHSLTSDTRYRVNEPLVVLGASIDNGSFSSPLRSSNSRGSLVSSGQISLADNHRRISQQERKPLYRYNSGIGDF